MAVRELRGSDRRSRPVARLGVSLERSLSTYVAAAAAAGVSVLAVPSAEARIVYTPANIDIPVNGGPVPLDLNHDGTADFSFSNVRRGGSNWVELWLGALGKSQSNGVWGRGSTYTTTAGRSRPLKGGHESVFAAVLRPGFTVGPNKTYFQKGSRWEMGLLVDAASFGGGRSTALGQWLYTEHRYLGLKFTIDGQIHYGWARFNVTVGKQGIAATITGYAYETVPNKPIVTGKTKGPDVVVFEPASLGRLAQGASGVSAWRAKPAR